MEELNFNEINAVSGGDGVATTAGVVVGVAAGALVIGTGGGILIAGVLGGAIWGGAHYLMNHFN
jgi:hypothetical protein